jgi:hypothetical protein
MFRVVAGSGRQKNSSSPVEWFLLFWGETPHTPPSESRREKGEGQAGRRAGRQKGRQAGSMRSYLFPEGAIKGRYEQATVDRRLIDDD